MMDLKADGQPFSTRIMVRFGDCDPAGIVFYPRYFEMFNGVVEDWCADGLGLSFHEMHIVRGIGLPAVHIETDFIAVSTLGETLRAELVVKKIGGTSITLAIRLQGPDGADRVRAQLVLVLMDLHKRRALPIPEEMGARIARFRVSP